ncbi:39S ribosomal protein L35, mitochondrial [Pieris brassicae]|uniref:Large ribosomal subunit protein bL35m n=1 Tax=Pieris brassicae TaxID=7116 RepID=A0A9P0TSJ5_PIEBR|nr:39S ribosomal protein L35, mitochondrial [Pieris brassicae]CAH4037037.1 unnamed protein product [Pieris brassicae]
MFRYTLSVIRRLRPILVPYVNGTTVICNETRSLSTIINRQHTLNKIGSSRPALIQNKQILDICNRITPISVRTVTKFSLKRGKRKTVKAAVRRFFRLDWGGWIRTKVGRNKKIWKKSQPQRRRLRQHVFCNATQSTLLDKMVTKFWKKPKYYVDDPYAPYHTREEYHITRKKPTNH